MRVLLDGHVIPIDRPTLAVALAAAARHAEASGRVIVSALADGAPLPDQALREPSDEFTTIQELALSTSSPGHVVGEMLTHAADALASIRATQQEAGVLIQRGETAKSQPLLETVFSVWQAVAGGVQQAAEMLGLNLAVLRVPDGYGDTMAVKPQIEFLVDKLRELHAAMQRQDWAATSDIVLFDLDELAKSWGQMLRGLAGVIAPAENP